MSYGHPFLCDSCGEVWIKIINVSVGWFSMSVCQGLFFTNMYLSSWTFLQPKSPFPKFPFLRKGNDWLWLLMWMLFVEAQSTGILKQNMCFNSCNYCRAVNFSGALQLEVFEFSKESSWTKLLLMGKKISLFYRVKEKYQGKNSHDSEFGHLKGFVGI